MKQVWEAKSWFMGHSFNWKFESIQQLIIHVILKER